MAVEWRRIAVGIAVGVAVVLPILTGPAQAQPAIAADKTAASSPAAHGPLDGMRFVGTIGPEDKRNLDDELHFAAGQFWSTNCVACGYRPGAYRSRMVGDAVHFQGALQSAGGGRFDYTGRVVGAQIDVRIVWSQQRWYGDIERKMAFVGTLAPAGSPPDVKAQCQRL